MKKYYISETIPKADGTKVYCVNKDGITHEFDDGTTLTYVEEIFRGSYEQCEEVLREFNESEEQEKMFEKLNA